MLGGPGIPNNLPDAVKGIPVNRKTDALFFLQTARIDVGRNAQEIQNNARFELAKYLIHYADGQTMEVPIIQDWNVGNYVQASPAALPGAALAWSAPYGKTGQSAAAWTQQWNNPRPDVEIQSIDLLKGKDNRGVPALLAITAATTSE
jgi:beta-galactosidase